ncbi:unnamed protein product [Cochlearia groenlandica]
MASSSLSEYRNWADLPSELTLSILHKLDSVEILEKAKNVCKSWRRVCKDPWMWQKIDIPNHGDLQTTDQEEEMLCREAVDRSQGGLVEIKIWYLVSDSLLHYIVDSSSNLRSLELANGYPILNNGLVEAIVKLPLLRELELTCFPMKGETIKIVGKSCPNLKSFKLSHTMFDYLTMKSDEYEDEALAIAETMHGLSRLELVVNSLSDIGLNAILNKCLNLEHLELHKCFCVKFVGDLEKMCYERIKVFRWRNDPTFVFT